MHVAPNLFFLDLQTFFPKTISLNELWIKMESDGGFGKKTTS